MVRTGKHFKLLMIGAPIAIIVILLVFFLYGQDNTSQGDTSQDYISQGDTSPEVFCMFDSVSTDPITTFSEFASNEEALEVLKEITTRALLPDPGIILEPADVPNAGAV